MKMDGRTTRIRFKVDGLENERIISRIEIVFFRINRWFSVEVVDDHPLLSEKTVQFRFLPSSLT